MRIVSISDIHANLHALQAVLEDIKQLEGEYILVVAGDFINTGPYPKETLDLLRSLNPIFVKGNHEDYVLNTWKRREIPVPPRAARERATAPRLSCPPGT